MNDELRELITLEDYLNRLLRRVQRRVIASGGKIEDGGDICGLSKAEALAEIEEEGAQSEGLTAADLNEIEDLERWFGEKPQPQNVSVQPCNRKRL